MNRCRSLVAGQARSFAAAGYSCTLIDFYGTGDSEGELRDATLAHWRDNLQQLVDTLQAETSAPLILWGMRLGALLALDFARTSAVPVQDMILWQPVSSGKMYVTQVLRQRVAALMVRDLPAETTKEIRARLERGEQVEVGGYVFGGQLIADIEGLDLEGMGGLCSGSIHWLEHVIEEGKNIGVAARKAVDKLVAQDNTVEVCTFTDPPIWQIHERDFAPQLLAATGSLLP